MIMMKGRMDSYFYSFEIFLTPNCCGKYFGRLCMLSAFDRTPGGKLLKILK